MCKGVGVDLCSISRMVRLLDNDQFLTRYFTPGEAAYIRGKGKTAAQTMAGIYAAKEAVLKALGVGLAVPLGDVEVCHTNAGQPYLQLHGKAAALSGSDRFDLSISHEADLAVAFVVRSAAG